MHQDTNGNVFFETNMEQWAKTFHNGRRSSIEIAGPSIPAQSEWIDIEDFSEEDSLDIFDLETSNAPSDGGKMCQIKWVQVDRRRKKKVRKITLLRALCGDGKN